MQRAQNFQLELEKQQQRQDTKEGKQEEEQKKLQEEFQRRRQQEKAHNEIMVRHQELKELEKRLERDTEKQEQLESQWQAMVAQYQDKKLMEAACARRKLEIKQRLEQIEACRKERDLLQSRLSNEAAKAARRVGQEATRYYEDQQYDFLCGPKNVEGQGDPFKISTAARIPQAPLPSELPQPMAAMFSSPGNGNGKEAETDSGNGSKYPEETGGEASSSSSSQIGEWLKTCRESYQSSKWELPSQEQDLASKKRKQQDVAGDQKKPKKEPEMRRQQDMVRKELLERIQEVKELQERLENEMKQQQECMDSSQREEMEEYKARRQLGQQRRAEQIEACRQERELLQARLRNERAKTAQRVGRETRRYYEQQQSDIRYGSKDFNLGGCTTNYVTSTDLSKMPTVPTVPRAPLPSELPQPMAAMLKGNGKASAGKGNGNEDGEKYPEETYGGEED
nr:trichohyalin-like [Drosophila kikkawai]